MMKVKGWKRKNCQFGEILLDLPKIWVKFMLIDKTIYPKEIVKQFTSDTMLGSVKEDRRTSEAEVSSEVHQNSTK